MIAARRKMRIKIGAVLGACAVLLTGCATAPGTLRVAPISVHGNMTTFESAPVQLAAARFYPGPATVKMGGIPNLVGEAAIPGFGEDGVADVATHAETQLLRYSIRNPNLRVILNVTEGLYRVVAKRSAGISSIRDLKGRKVATIPTTSSGYFFHLMLQKEGMSLDDVQVVSISPMEGMAAAIQRGDVDAVVIWEPYSEQARRILGSDAIEFSGEGVYRELFNLNTTAENLADPAKRAKIVTFVRAVIDASAEVRRDPSAAQALVRARGNYEQRDMVDGWKHHAFLASMPSDLLDVLVYEEQWLAARDKRQARPREVLATLIDDSVYREALALRPAR